MSQLLPSPTSDHSPIKKRVLPRSNSSSSPSRGFSLPASQPEGVQERKGKLSFIGNSSDCRWPQRPNALFLWRLTDTQSLPCPIASAMFQKSDFHGLMRKDAGAHCSLSLPNGTKSLPLAYRGESNEPALSWEMEGQTTGATARRERDTAKARTTNPGSAFRGIPLVSRVWHPPTPALMIQLEQNKSPMRESGIYFFLMGLKAGKGDK